MNILSLFNGCSGAYMALDDLGIEIDKYYVSEVDKFANQAAKLVYPESIFLGDVRKVDVSKLEKIDLVCGGSPCTDLSFAGSQSGLICNTFEDYLQLRNEWLQTGNEDLYFHNGKFQQSILFWEFVRILRDIQKYNTDVYFFLENVHMEKKHMKIINNSLGLAGQNLNSNLVSAQNRNRWYWTNISTRKQGLFEDIETYIEPPKDRGILLKDVVEENVNEKFYIKNPKFNFSGMNLNGKANTQRTGASCSQTDKHNYDLIGVVNDKLKLREVEKSSCVDANYFKGIDNHASRTAICVAMRGRNPYNPNDRTVGAPTKQRLEPQRDGKTNCISTVSKDNLVLQLPRGKNKGGAHKDKCPTVTSNSFEQNNIVLCKNYIQLDISGKSHKSQQDRFHYLDVKHGAVPASRTESKTEIIGIDYRLRRLTPKEVMELQTVPKKFQMVLLESGISDSQLYKQQGNGWTIEMIKQYFKPLKKEKASY